jgi:hypothetical protein
MATNEFWYGGTLYLQNAADTFNTFQSIVYSKGACVVHMLRGLSGDEVFFDALKDYAQNPEFMYANASTEDLQMVFETATGMDLQFFFEQWVYDEYYPFYYYNYLQNSENGLYVMIHQAQEELYGYRPVFEMPVQLRINYNDGTDTLITVWNDEQTQQFYFELDKEVSTVNFDPDKWILRKAELNSALPVGISDNTLDENIRIYPNPFTSELNIQLDDSFAKSTEITILDINGKRIQYIPSISAQTVKWNGYNSKGVKVKPGIYFIRIKSDLEVVLKKVTLLK